MVYIYLVADLLICANGGGPPHIDVLLSQWRGVLRNHAYIVAGKGMLVVEQLGSIIFTTCVLLLIS